MENFSNGKLHLLCNVEVFYFLSKYQVQIVLNPLCLAVIKPGCLQFPRLVPSGKNVLKLYKLAPQYCVT